MYPVLFEIGSWRVSTYAVMVALGGIVSFILLSRRRARMGLVRADHFWLLVNAIIIGSFVGGRLVYLAKSVPLSSPDFFTEAVGLRRGFSGTGVLGGVVLGAGVLCWALRINFLSVLDSIGLVAPLWNFFWKLGCLGAGCCYGRPAPPSLAWSVTFTHPRALVPADLLGCPLHPAQLYEALGSLCVAGFLYFVLLRRLDAGRLRDGTLAIAFFALHVCVKVVTGHYRGDTPAGGSGIDLGQAFSLLLLASAVALLVVLQRRRGPPARPQPPEQGPLAEPQPLTEPRSPTEPQPLTEPQSPAEPQPPQA